MKNRLFLLTALFISIVSSVMAQPNLNWSDEAIYFVIPDRYNNADPSNDYAGDSGDTIDDVLRHGFNPKHKGYYHGGDLKGLTQKLDYIKELGITALWISPIFKNNPVQKLLAQASEQNILNLSDSGYHGYWITDFTQVDPHLGTNDELKELIDKAHEMGLKVYFDIIVNHTADIVKYEECPHGCLYQPVAKYPYSTKGKRNGDVINRGFIDGVWTEENFAKLVDPNWAFTTYVEPGKENVKVPAWLNDPTLYHNRGNTSFTGKEDSELGDFKGLDDLFTEHETVVKGMIDIYKFWIREFSIDGFRLDTYKHVNQEFWREFIPPILEYAKEHGKDDFYAFAEVWFYDAERLSYYSKATPAPASLDFAFQRAALEVFVKGDGTEKFRRFFLQDDFYNGGYSESRVLPTFTGNHDMGRIGYFMKGEQPLEEPKDWLRRSQLAHAFMITSRGVPVIYYGDEQGFTGDGGDKDSREDMFPSRVPEYNDNLLLGTEKTTADDNFDTSHPIFQTIKTALGIRKEHKALRRGVLIHRDSSRDAGIIAFSRVDTEERVEYLVAFNTLKEPAVANIDSLNATTAYEAIYPATGAAVTSDDTAHLKLTVPPMDYVIYRAASPVPPSESAPEIKLNLSEGERISGHIEICTLVKTNSLAKATFFAKYPGDENWNEIGVDYSPAPFDPTMDVSACGKDTGYVYRMMLLGSHSERYGYRSMPDNLPIAIKVELDDYNQHVVSAEANVVFDNRFRKLVIHYENGNHRTSAFGIAKDMPFVYPSEMKGNTVELFWPGDSKYMYLFFDSYSDEGIEIDARMRLEFGKHFLSNYKDTTGSKGYSEIYINNKHQVSGENNFINDETVKPDVMFVSSPDAPAQFGDTTMYVRGDMNDWGIADPMQYNSKNNAYEATVTLTPGDLFFRYADDQWSDTPNFGGPFLKSTGMHRGDGSSPLPIAVPFGETNEYKFSFIQAELKGKPYQIYRISPVAAPAGQAVDEGAAADDSIVQPVSTAYLVGMLLLLLLLLGFAYRMKAE